MDELIPLLEKAAAMGEDARVLNIKGGNGNLRLDLNDLGFRKNSSSVAQTKATTLYNNIMVEVRLVVFGCCCGRSILGLQDSQ